ncbi:hypothetical protein SNEBB_009398 [Seison nebaliae]|nr:hypothetical protein SNEBB_009398 [Seison nebaliae]
MVVGMKLMILLIVLLIDEAISTEHCPSNYCANNGVCQLNTCRCGEGYHGKYCELPILTCLSSKTLSCSDNNKCTNFIGSHECECKELNYKYDETLDKCICQDGWKGDNCEISTIVSCDNYNCGKGECQIVDGKQKCKCYMGYSGNLCELDKCSSDPCKNNGTCKVYGSYYKCECLPNFTGSHCEELIDYCLSDPCENDGICTNDMIGSSYKCECISPFVGLNCSQLNCTLDCVNGNCTIENGTAVCNCMTNYTGKLCDMEICSNMTCLNGMCNLMGGCDCAIGWTGEQCQIDRCENVTCLNDGKCIFDAQINNITCQCSPSFTGDDCSMSLTVENCNGTSCNSSDLKNCSIVNGTENCECADGYTGEKCDELICQKNCQNNGGCLFFQNGTEYCNCTDSFTGDVCQNEIDDNITTFCENGYVLDDGNCSCNDGWKGDNCSEIECCNDYCYNNGTCYVNENERQCNCSGDWGGERCNGTICDEIKCIHGECVIEDDVAKCECEVPFTGNTCALPFQEDEGDPENGSNLLRASIFLMFTTLFYSLL